MKLLNRCSKKPAVIGYGRLQRYTVKSYYGEIKSIRNPPQADFTRKAYFTYRRNISPAREGGFVEKALSEDKAIAASIITAENE